MNDRDQVYAAINQERDYQDKLPATRTDGKQRSVGDYCTMMTYYAGQLVAAWTENPGDTQAMDVMRKIAGIAVRAMEEHGIVWRGEQPPASDAGEDGPGAGWRYLAPGETKQEGDEFMSRAAGGWRPIRYAGHVVEPGEGRLYRRRITTAHAAAPAATASEAENQAVGRRAETSAGEAGTGDTRASDSAMVEAAAEVVYAAMLFERKSINGCPGAPWVSAPPWVPGGNSLAQDEARAAARKILAMAPPAAGVTLTDIERWPVEEGRDALRCLGRHTYDEQLGGLLRATRADK